MQVNIYLDDINIEDLSLDKFCMNPILFTNYFKKYLEKKHLSFSRQVTQAIRSNAPLLHIKNTTIKSYNVATPYCGKVQSDTPKDLLSKMVALIGIIGTYPILYEDENDNIIRVVAPRKDSHNESSSQSPFTDLDWHVDAAYRPMSKDAMLSPMPDYLVFGVINQGQEQLPITYVALENVIKELKPEDLAIGLRPEFTVLSADSFKDRVISKNVSLLLKGDDGLFYNRITLQNTIPQTERAEYFLQKIRSILDKPCIRNVVNVEVGDVVILNNKTTLHKRDSYEPKWNGTDRYFIRIYSVKDLNQGILSNAYKPWEWR